MDQTRAAPARTPLGLKLLAVIGALIVVPGGAFFAIAFIGTGGKVAIAAGVVWWVVASAVIGKTLLKRRPDIRTPVRATLALAAVASIVLAFVVSRGNTVDEDIVTAAPSAEVPSPAERDAALAGSEGGGDQQGEQAEKPADDGAAKAKKPKEEDHPAAAADPEPSAAPEPEPESKPKPKPAPARNVQLLSGTFQGESGHSGDGKAAVIKLAKGGRMLTFSQFDVDPGAGGLRVYLHQGEAASDDLGEFIELAKLKGTKGDQQYPLPADLNLQRYNSVVIWCVPFSTRIAQAPLS